MACKIDPGSSSVIGSKNVVGQCGTGCQIAEAGHGIQDGVVAWSTCRRSSAWVTGSRQANSSRSWVVHSGSAEWGGGEPGNGISAGLCLAGTQEIGSTVWGQIEARGGWAAATHEQA